MPRPSRRGLPGLVALLALMIPAAAPALAGDRALVNVVGYSVDQRYFAFEEYGIQDGSGFAYSNIYLVDVDTDRWVVGTPERNQASSENETLGVVRQESFDAMQPRLTDLKVNLPAETLAIVGDGAVGNDGQELVFARPGPAGSGGMEGKYRLEIDAFPAEAAKACAGYMAESPKGFSLSVAAGDGPARYAHTEDTIPRSRGCPLAYRIYGVFLPFRSQDVSRAVALISVYAHGFEGSDRRFIAVPLNAAFKDGQK